MATGEPPLGKHKGGSEAVRQSFFPYFMFSLLCATLRWQWQGVPWTSVATLAIFGGPRPLSGDVLRDPAFELNCFLTRSVYLVIAAVMLGYLSTYEGEVRIALAEQVERTATMEDRLRLACDLHDGPLPPLTGTALQLEIAGRPVETDPQNVGGSLIHPRVARGQATALRTLMRQLEPDRPAVPGLAPSLTTLLEELGDRVEVHWGLPVVSSLDAPPRRLRGRSVIFVPRPW